MYRSPPKLRSGSKGERVPLPGNQSSSPSSPLPARLQSTIHMSPTPADKTAKVDQAVVAEYVNKCLAGDDFVSKLVAKLEEQLKGVVEEAVRSALATVHAEMETLRGEVADLRQQMKQLDERLLHKSDELEQYQRRNNVRIFGIEEKEGEITDDLVVQLCRDKLKVDMPVHSICRSHRVGKQLGPATGGEKRHRPIIVRFTSYRERRRVFEAKKQLKGTGITIREDLTRTRQELLKAAVAQHGLRSTWTQDGRILWRSSDGGRGSATKLSDLQPTAV